MSVDKNNRPYALVSEVKDGSYIEVDRGFTCIDPKLPHRVFSHENGDLYINCNDGKHDLIGSMVCDTTEEAYYKGIYLVKYGEEPIVMSVDKNNRPYALVSEVKDGDYLEFDKGFWCVEPYVPHKVYMHTNGSLYVNCKEGTHYISGLIVGDTTESAYYDRVYQVDTYTLAKSGDTPVLIKQNNNKSTKTTVTHYVIDITAEQDHAIRIATEMRGGGIIEFITQATMEKIERMKTAARHIKDDVLAIDIPTHVVDGQIQVSYMYDNTTGGYDFHEAAHRKDFYIHAEIPKTLLTKAVSIIPGVVQLNIEESAAQ